MNRIEKILTSESVCPGHPDKICDQISDALVDLYLRKDPLARVAIETVVSTQRVIILGEVSTTACLTAEQREATVRRVIQEIGYEQQGFHWQTCIIEDLIHLQSPDIAQGVVTGGAGDQGFMYGYACDETPALMPAPLYYVHRLLESLEQAQNDGLFSGFLPDGKAQLCLRYDQDKPIGLDRIVLSKQHREEYLLKDIRADLIAWMPSCFPEGWMCAENHIYINPTGRFVLGGPEGDSGLTGRKIIVDSYGGAAPHGGGAFSGKDGTKVDRSGAYMMRYLAKNIVAAGLAKKCMTHISYSIGRAEPLSFFLTTQGTGIVPDQHLTSIVSQLVDLTPQGIIQTLKLHHPCYQRTATYGHFGRTPTLEGHFSWEKLDLVNSFKSALI